LPDIQKNYQNWQHPSNNKRGTVKTLKITYKLKKRDGENPVNNVGRENRSLSRLYE